MISLTDVYGFLLDEPYCVPLRDVLRLTDLQVFALYNPPRDRKTGARKESPAGKGWWVREDPAAAKAKFLAMGTALKFSPAVLEEKWREARLKRGKKP